MSYTYDSGSGQSTPVALPEHFSAAWNQAASSLTGSISLKDGDVITDTSGHKRLEFTDTGGTIIYDEANNDVITVNTDETTTFAKGITLTTGDVSTTVGTLDVNNGATVVQGTGGTRTDAVAINFPTGKVTGDDASFAAGATAVHTVNNSTVAATDVVIINKISGDVDTIAFVDTVAAGSFNVRLHHIAGSGADTTAFVYNFVVIKGSHS